MAKTKYKIEEVKKDKTISFRIPNQTYKLLEKLSQKSNEGINTFARKLLTEHLYSKNPQSDLKDLKKEKEKLEAELKKMGQGEPDWEKLYEKKKEELEEIESNREDQRSKILIAVQELDQLNKKIEQLEEIECKDDLMKLLNKFKKREVWIAPKNRGSREKYG